MIFRFTKSEGISVLAILGIIGVAMILNLQVSYRRGRDAQRKTDIRNIYDALQKYQNDFGAFPFSEEGKIVACNGQVDEKNTIRFSPCEWYKDSLKDQFDPDYPAYIVTLPGDPQQGKGAYYYYLSNGKHFQIYATLESSSEDEYDPAIVERQLPCGNRICNFGRSDGQTPLDKSLEEYENELSKDAAQGQN